MQKSSQGSCLFYVILPAVQRCSKKTKHTAEERITAQQNLRNGRVLPWGGAGGGRKSKPEKLLQHTTQGSKTQDLKPCWQMDISDGSSQGMC